MFGCIFQEKGEFMTAGWCYNEKCILHGKLIKFILKEEKYAKEKNNINGNSCDP